MSFLTIYAVGILLSRITVSHKSNMRKRERKKGEKNERSVSTGQIRRAQGLVSEDLIGLTLAADLPQLSLEEISLAVSKNLSLWGWMTSS